MKRMQVLVLILSVTDIALSYYRQMLVTMSATTKATHLNSKGH